MYHHYQSMMTSSNGNIFGVTSPLCRQFTGHGWIPRTKASDAELWCFLWLHVNKQLSKQSWGWWFEMPSHSLWRHCNDHVHWLSQRGKPPNYITVTPDVQIHFKGWISIGWINSMPPLPQPKTDFLWTWAWNETDILLSSLLQYTFWTSFIEICIQLWVETEPIVDAFVLQILQAILPHLVGDFTFHHTYTHTHTHTYLPSTHTTHFSLNHWPLGNMNDIFNSLAPGKFEWHFRFLIFQIISVTDGWGISCEIALRWMSLDLTNH